MQRGRPTRTARLRRWCELHVTNCVESLRELLARPGTTLLTATVIGIALALPATLNLLVSNGRALAGDFDDLRDFSVYLSPGLELSVAEKLAADVRAFDGIEQVTVISADAALAEFAAGSGLADALAALDNNPLPHTLLVRPADSLAVPALEDLQRRLLEQPTVDIVQIDTQWVQRLNAILELLRRLVIACAVVLTVGVIIVVGNTIRLDIQSRRDEIEVIKLLGASDGFVRRPFLYTGIWYGVLGSLVALLLLVCGGWLLAGPAEQLLGLYAIDSGLQGLDSRTALALAGAGVLAGWGGAWSAVARHLRAVQPT
ncbi:MAG: permease-like cell division protein FtsX [Gammaproteobacteria bacterium]|jgi:cell division transport system permease protein|nr:permease-like cell division protein FtsX [Gammaproteobacteria bacterium]